MRRVHVGSLRVRTVIVAGVEVEVAACVSNLTSCVQPGAGAGAAPRLPVGAGLVRPDGVPLPAAQHVTRKGIAGVCEPGQLVHVIDNQPMANVVDGVTPIQEWLGLIGGKS